VFSYRQFFGSRCPFQARVQAGGLRPGDAKRLRPCKAYAKSLKQSNCLFFYPRRSTIYHMNKAHYIDTSPCRNGHTAPRLISTGACTECTRLAQKRFKANPENRARMNIYENERRRKLGWTNPAQKIRQQRYDRKRRGLPEPLRPTPENCECCGKSLEGGVRTHLDHCHNTKKFRGWLCNTCNLGIGALGDTIEGLERALAYLKRAE
jgi:hypothetical protein